MSADRDILANRIHFKVSKSRPHGRGVEEVTWNGQVLDDLVHASVDFDADAFHKVTLTFNAHVTIEEVD